MRRDQERRAVSLRAMGLIVGERDKRRNTAFRGCFMVAQPCEEHELPTESAASGGFCVVGDDLGFLIDTAWANFAA